MCLARFRFNLDRHKPFLDLAVRIQNRANNEFHRLRGADGTEIRSNIAAFAADCMARGTVNLGSCVDFRAMSAEALLPDFVSEARDLRQIKLPRFAAEPGRLDENILEFLVRLTGGTHPP